MYQVIARKYRPQSFEELIGQEHVQKTLTNAIGSGRVAHGYIFSGQRGTGKTTVARILARCLNCIDGPSARPCGVCASCTEIAAGNSPDVIEIDAASNRGINEMREIRENVRYRPARDRYKVFIIDEAHQITKEAFNALLKTLEEPPEWVVFLLCTTEAYEIPNTIASRCQHFTFRSVDFTQLMERMRYIVQQEGIETDDEALSVIAQAGEGSVRDSLSALDQAIACCGRTLHVADLRALLGLFGAEALRAVPMAIQDRDPGRMIDIVQELENNGQSLQHFCRELSRYWRNLLVAKISGKPTRLIAASDAEQQKFIETAAGFSEEDLTRYLNLTLDLYKTLQSSLQPRLHLELGLVKLVQAGKLRSIEEALSSLGSNARTAAPPLTATSRAGAPRPASFQAAPPPPPPANSAAAITSQPISAQPIAPQPISPQAISAQPISAQPISPQAISAQPISPQAISAQPISPQAPAVAPAATPAISGDFAADLENALRTAGLNFSADAVAHSEISVNGGEILIRCSPALMLALKDASVQRAASQIIGRPAKIKLEAGKVDKPAAAVSERRPASEDALRERALSDPGVKRFQELFPDAQVRTVRNLNE